MIWWSLIFESNAYKYHKVFEDVLNWLLSAISVDITSFYLLNLFIFILQWMPLLEFVKQPLIEGDSMFKKIIDICIARLGKRYCGLSKHQLVSKFDGRLSCLYYNVIDAADVNCRGNWDQAVRPIAYHPLPVVLSCGMHLLFCLGVFKYSNRSVSTWN